ncbi:SurA N-terminal domain-containing protein [Chitinibacter bivalviorum]|uniref:Periplasmic chaperone PpiD n=1 Tax=Chitinibacter bivalviorum TaxID=2739434 RepID=A0A7H9BF39_9NEIS|nr:SurA N-terminal domain-containing protein [Chitinibacter bivalviorum]QLG87187.1 SurA N-terminal domain-containing protein [Chitinibacter bivalviorum]
MFEFVHNNKTAVQIVLGLVSAGLVIGFGLSGYSAMGESDNYLAKVGKTQITERQLAEAIGNQAVPDDMKPMVVEQLVSQQLLQEKAQQLRMTVPDAVLREAIGSIPAFQVDGKFDSKRYQELLAAQQMTPTQFEDKLKKDLVLRQLMDGVMQTGFVSNSELQRLNSLMGDKREVSVATLSPEQYLAKVSVSDAEIKQYYDANLTQFKAPEMVKLEYVSYSQADLAAQQTVSDAEVQKYFDEHKSELAKEERKVRHILLTAPKDMKADDKAKVRQQAEVILLEVKKNPAQFSAIAKAKSQDPGSAANGGDLGYFAKGAMVKPFEEVAFKLKKGEISGIVESDFGFHILVLDDVKGASLADVKPQIEQKIKQDKAQVAYQAQVDKFSELVYQQADSLKPAADALKLKVVQSGWVTRKAAEEPLLNNPKLIEAVFSDDVLKKKHNSEAIEVGRDQLVSARLLEYKPSQTQALADVSAVISSKLKLEKAAKLLASDGEAKLKALNAGNAVELAWGEAKPFSRIGEQGVAEADLKAIFKADNSKPVYVGANVPNRGYVFYKVGNSVAAPALTPENKFRMGESLAKMYGQVELTAYLDSLKKDIKVQYSHRLKKSVE